MHSSKVFLEELGRNQAKCLEVVIYYDVVHSEPATYDYPGYQGHIDLCEVRVVSYSDDGIKVKSTDRPDWFDMLDSIAFHRVSVEWDKWSERFAEEMAGV